MLACWWSAAPFGGYFSWAALDAKQGPTREKIDRNSYEKSREVLLLLTSTRTHPPRAPKLPTASPNFPRAPSIQQPAPVSFGAVLGETHRRSTWPHTKTFSRRLLAAPVCHRCWRRSSRDAPAGRHSWSIPTVRMLPSGTAQVGLIIASSLVGQRL